MSDHADRAEVMHIMEDVANALVENRHDDPQFVPDVLGEFMAHVGAMAAADLAEWQDMLDRNPGLNAREHVQHWATNVLRRIQIRAISGIPFDQIGAPFEEEDHR